MRITINDSSDIFEVIYCSFTDCGNTGDQEYIDGGALHFRISNGATVSIFDSTFKGCTADYGGAIVLYVTTDGQATIYNVSIQECIAHDGGGIYLQLHTGAVVTISGLCTFSECSAKYGGGFYAEVFNRSSQIIFLDSLSIQGCSNCTSGGGAYIHTFDANISISNILFDQCNAQYAGGLLLDGDNSKVYLNGTVFQNCTASVYGGAIRILINEEHNSFEIIDIIITNCSAQIGGGIYCETVNSELIIYNSQILFCLAFNGSGGIFFDLANSELQIFNVTVSECRTYYGNGGGLYSNINRNSRIVLDQSCYFYECQSQNGGDALFQSCQASEELHNTNQSQGFGGGIFLTGSGDYEIQSYGLSLIGMKIVDNTADNGGNSLFLSISKVKQFCQFGIKGDNFWFKDCCTAALFSTTMFVSGGAITYLVIEILVKKLILIFPASFSLGNQVLHIITILLGFKSDDTSMDVLDAAQIVQITVIFVVRAQVVVAQDVLMDVQIAAQIVLNINKVIKKNKEEQKKLNSKNLKK
ncbi:MAG: hypothetical protein EZS28_020775 [Streblomastix strix]|uniref:Right handed beta helix domain-containing protein n=1 Tax=Streblomastix strix TaxID=222440 RepID=A0A5J4VN12_9EUKA|nr:MAG: hypothetical protein EZS28_020775 [Streblomastix strix]